MHILRIFMYKITWKIFNYHSVSLSEEEEETWINIFMFYFETSSNVKRIKKYMQHITILFPSPESCL